MDIIREYFIKLKQSLYYILLNDSPLIKNILKSGADINQLSAPDFSSTVFRSFPYRKVGETVEGSRNFLAFFCEISVSHDHYEKFGVLPMTFVTKHQPLSALEWGCSFLPLRRWQAYIAEYP